MEELSTIPDRFWHPLGLWLGLEREIFRSQFKGARQVLETFQHNLIKSTKLSVLVPEILYQQIIEDEYMTIKKADEIVEQIDDSNKETVRRCLHDMLLQREEKITSALVKTGLKETAEELKGQQ